MNEKNLEKQTLDDEIIEFEPNNLEYKIKLIDKTGENDNYKENFSDNYLRVLGVVTLISSIFLIKNLIR